MTRTHAARCLLALGPLQLKDFRAITGWRESIARDVLVRLQRQGKVRMSSQRGTNRYMYELAE